MAVLDVADHEFEKTTQIFLEWLQKIGVNISPKMALADFRSQNRGRGAVALQDIDEDEILFSVPRTSVLSVKNFISARGITASPTLHNTLTEMPSWLSLTTAILSELSSSNSSWQPYFSVLPRELDTLVFWSDDELRELQASAVVSKIGKAQAESEFRNQILPLGVCGDNVEHFHLVASTIMAYAFDIPEEDNEIEDAASDDFVADEEKTTLAMIPLADMLNSDAQLKNARLFCDNEDLEMRATRNIFKGEEILNDYGELPRADLVRRYGYITDNYAAYDVVEISMELIVSAFVNGIVKDQQEGSLQLRKSQIEERLEVARREDVFEDSYDIAYSTAEEPGIPDELLAVLYILLADDSRLVLLINNDTSLPSRSKLSTSLAGHVLKQLFFIREQEYATTLEQDEQLLKQDTESYPPRMLMAISIRLGEKKVLRKATEMAFEFQGNDRYMRNGKTQNEIEREADRPRKRARMN